MIALTERAVPGTATDVMVMKVEYVLFLIDMN